MTDVTVVIPTYNRARLLERALSSLAGQTLERDRYEVIVVDDGGCDRAGEVVKKYGGIYVRQENRGPAAARNRGIKMARAAVIAFTDDDCVVDKKWLAEIAGTFKRDKTLGWLKGKTKSLENEALPLALERYLYSSKTSGATNNIAYRKDVLLDAGLFDESYPKATYEDIDLKWRAAKKGYRSGYNERMVVWHPHEATMDDFEKTAYVRGFGLGHFFKRNLFRYPAVALGSVAYELGLFPFYYCYVRSVKRPDYSRRYIMGVKTVHAFRGFRDNLCGRRRDLDKRRY